jgi:NADPH-dependent ferric siderophore reductase
VLCPTVEDNGGVDIRPPPDTDWVLLTVDETAVPALAGILDWVGPAMPVRAWIEVHDPADVRRRFRRPAGP